MVNEGVITGSLKEKLHTIDINFYSTYMLKLNSQIEKYMKLCCFFLSKRETTPPTLQMSHLGNDFSKEEILHTSEVAF